AGLRMLRVLDVTRRTAALHAQTRGIDQAAIQELDDWTRERCAPPIAHQTSAITPQAPLIATAPHRGTSAQPRQMAAMPSSWATSQSTRRYRTIGTQRTMPAHATG